MVIQEKPSNVIFCSAIFVTFFQRKKKPVSLFGIFYLHAPRAKGCWNLFFVFPMAFDGLSSGIVAVADFSSRHYKCDPKTLISKVAVSWSGIRSLIVLIVYGPRFPRWKFLKMVLDWFMTPCQLGLYHISIQLTDSSLISGSTTWQHFHQQSHWYIHISSILVITSIKKEAFWLYSLWIVLRNPVRHSNTKIWEIAGMLSLSNTIPLDSLHAISQGSCPSSRTPN